MLRLLRTLQTEGRPPVEAELPVLAAWSSWGAVPGVFDEGKPEWAGVRAELHDLLSETAYDAARRTVINAHYTDPRIVAEMWSAATALGVTVGSALEMGCGSGTFIGLAPEHVAMTGVELDPTTAAVAAALYPDATIRAESFADSRFIPGSFDVAIGNVPFGDLVLHDPVHNQNKHSIHNHFLVKAVDLVQPGGLVVALTSAYTMDAQNPAARREIFDRADLVAAVRLPTGAHRRTAGTDALTDLLILRRRLAGEKTGDETWLRTYPHTIDGATRRINRYFIAHPDRILGDLSIGHGMYGAETLTVTADLDTLHARLHSALASIVTDAKTAGQTAEQRRPATAQAIATAPDQSKTIGTVSGSPTAGFTRHTDIGPEPIDVPRSQRAELAALIAMGDMAHALLRAEAATTIDTADITSLRADLASDYRSYVQTYGPINRFKQIATAATDRRTGEPIVQRRRPPVFKHLRTHPLTPLIRALEVYDDSTGAHSPASLLSERVVVPRRPPLGVDSADEAVSVALDTDGEVTLYRVAQLLGCDETEARTRLGELVYDDPETRRIVPRAEYLSGNIRTKLAAATAATAAGNSDLAVNVAALQSVMPAQLGPAEISAQIGAVWISAEDHQRFLRELLGDRHATVIYGGPSSWEVKAGKYNTAATSVWGTDHKSAGELFEALLNRKSVRVTSESIDGKRVLDPTATEAAKDKAAQIAERFATWVWEDPERASRLAGEYNERFNSLVLRDYTIEGQRLSLPGLAATMTPRPHQRAAVARMISEPSVGLFHEVGAGKTGEMVMGAMELRRLGLASKVAVVVPNHMLEQFSREWLQWYPQARILAASSDDLAADSRREFVARVATGDWDGIVMTRTAFEKLTVSETAYADYQRRQITEARAQLELARTNGATRTVKQMEKRLVREEEALKAKLDSPRDAGISFEDTGIDYLYIDEAHAYKNLRTVVVGAEGGIEGSKRATDLDMKLDLLRARHGRRVATLATATPIANSITEAHVMLRYLRPDLLAAAGVEAFDAWAATFGRQVEGLEMGPGGDYRMKSRFASFQNVPELLRMWHVAADVKTARDLNLPTPLLAEREDGQRVPEVVVVEPSAAMGEHMSQIRARIRALGSPFSTGKGEDNMLAITNDGRSAALDLHLVGRHTDEPQKIDVAAARIHEIWRETKDRQYTDDTGEISEVRGSLQLVFCDQSTPKADRWNVYNALQAELVARGMQPKQIRFMHDAKNDVEKARLFAACRSGDVAVLIGSTEKMGVGTNVQRRAIALHHLDCPWRPADLQQRDGRIVRQGNQNDEVRVMRYVTGRSFDTYNWQTIERKAKFIDQIMNPKFGAREIEDIDGGLLSLQETMAVAADDPLLLEKVTVDTRLGKLQRLEKAHQGEHAMLAWKAQQAEAAITRADSEEPTLAEAVAQAVDTRGDAFRADINGHIFTDRPQAASAVRDALLTGYHLPGVPIKIDVILGGHGFTFTPRVDRATVDIEIKGAPRSTFPALLDAFRQGVGGIQRLENRVAKLPELLTELRRGREASKTELEAIAAQIDKPFPHADQLRQTRREAETLQARMDERAAQAQTPEAPASDGPPAAGSAAAPQEATPGPDAQQPPRPAGQRPAAAAWRPDHSRHDRQTPGRGRD